MPVARQNCVHVALSQPDSFFAIKLCVKKLVCATRGATGMREAGVHIRHEVGVSAGGGMGG